MSALLTYDEAAARLGVSRRTFNRLLIHHRDTLRPLVFNHRIRRIRAAMLARIEKRFKREAEARGLARKEGNREHVPGRIRARASPPSGVFKAL